MAWKHDFLCYFFSALLIIIGLNYWTDYKTYAAHHVKRAPYAQIVNDYPDAESFMILHSGIKVQQLTDIYTSSENISRFPGLWFYKIYDDSLIDVSAYDVPRDHFSHAIQNDIVTHKPDLIIIPYYKEFEPINAVYRYAMKNPDFSSYFNAHYQKAGDGLFNLQYYVPSFHDQPMLISYTVYERRSR